MKALVVVQCFPPLLKNAGGVSKRYLTLCRALIDGLGWEVSLMTPVDVSRSREPDVDRWMAAGLLTHIPARGVRIRSTTDGVAVFLDLFSFVNGGFLLKELLFRRGYDLVVTDDVPWRFELLLLTRTMAVPTVVTSHTDITHMTSYKGVVKLVWFLHMLCTRLAAVHATVSRVFGAQLRRTYHVPVNAVWPPILWSPEFQSDIADWTDLAKEQRKKWLEALEAQGCKPKAIFLSAGRWAGEKRIHLLIDALPEDCALVIVGDGTSDYAKRIEDSGLASARANVLPLRKMLSGRELRISYAAADLFLSASNFETLGNTIIEAWCSGTPVAVQPAQGHMEFVKDGINSWFVDFDAVDEARATLRRIVAGGLDTPSLASVLPEFVATGAKLRKADFAHEFEDAVIKPALEVGRTCYSLALPWGIVEVLKRVGAFIVCFVAFFVIRSISRTTYIFARDPEFEVLGKLGGAVEDKRISSVPSFPCLRLFGDKTKTPEFERKRSGDTSTMDGTDYESHYKCARRGSSSVLKEFQAVFGGASPGAHSSAD